MIYKTRPPYFLRGSFVCFLFILIVGLAACTQTGDQNGDADGTPIAVETLDQNPTIPAGNGSKVPLTDLGSGTYFGFEGGLYPGGVNEMPAQHAQVGLERAGRIQPLTPTGNPSPDGNYVLLSIGMANTAEGFCGRGPTDCDPWSFGGLAKQSSAVNQSQLVIINGATYSGDASRWNIASSANYNRIRDNALTPLGLNERQVQIVWLKVANNDATNRPSLPDPQADAYALLQQLGEVVRALKIRYPNLQQVFISSRSYGGFSGASANPEPYAYESGFAVKWLIEAQIRQMEGQPENVHAGNLNYNRIAPWIAWGPYLWADGPNPRADGFSWKQSDFEGDGSRPSQTGEQKIGNQLLQFFSSLPVTTPWFLGEKPVVIVPPTSTPASASTTAPISTPTPVEAATPDPVVVTPTPPASTGNDQDPIPLIDMVAGGNSVATYFGFSGGLYPGGNEMPLEHAQAGLEQANLIQPLDTDGNPSENGKIVFLGVGMSNAAREFGVPGRIQNWTFIGLTATDPEVNHDTLALITGARSGQDAPDWEDANDYNYNWVRDNQLIPNGVSESQVQVIWLKQANGDAGSRPSLPASDADAYVLMERMGNILRALHSRYPNLRQVFISSRTYAGYAVENRLNPEPYAYESGFAIKWLIEAQIRQMAGGGSPIDPFAGDLNYNSVAPWIAWGPYMWANGATPRSDGLVWLPGDYGPDGTHPFTEGQRKVANMLLTFFKSSPLTQCWFLNNGACGLP